MRVRHGQVDVALNDATYVGHGELRLLLEQGRDRDVRSSLRPLNIQAGIVQGIPNSLCNGEGADAVRTANRDRDRDGC